MDNKLSIALKKVKENLSMDSISEFYFYGLELRPRVYNPAFQSTIELVTKAFLFQLSPDAFNDQLIEKVKGAYHLKRRVPFVLENVQGILLDLRKNKNFRYKNQIDFYLHKQDTQERNPFVRHPLVRSPINLHVKILMKDFKAYLNGEKDESLHTDQLFHALRTGETILFIENFAELWYHQGQIFALPLFEF